MRFEDNCIIGETTTCSTTGALLICTLTGLSPGQDYEISVRGTYSSGSLSQYGTATNLTTSK